MIRRHSLAPLGGVIATLTVALTVVFAVAFTGLTLCNGATAHAAAPKPSQLQQSLEKPVKSRKKSKTRPKFKSKSKPKKHATTRTSDATRATVAVLYFDYAGKNEDLAVLRKGLAQMLISDLSRHERLHLVERTRLEAVLAELKLGKSRKFDRKTVARVGKILGAQYLVLGSYFSLMGTLRIDARVVAVNSGRIIASVGAGGKVDNFLAIQSKVASALGAHLQRKLPVVAQGVGMGRHRKRPNSKRRKRLLPRRPKRLRTRTAVRYAKALDAKDRGDMAAAKAHLKAVIKAQPDFGLARQDLAMFVQ